MGKWFAWAKEHEAMLGTMPDIEAATILGLKVAAVAARRRLLGIRPFSQHKSQAITGWKKEEIALLGTMSDAAVAHVVNRKLNAVQQMRHRLKIPPFNRRTQKEERYFITWEDALRFSGPMFFEALAKHYQRCLGGKLSYQRLAKISHYSLSRMQKWFTSGTAQEPLGITVKHHLWLLGKSWGEK